MRVVPRLLLAAYLAVLAVVVWSPQPDDPRNPGILRLISGWLAALGLPLEPTYDTLEVAANVVLFVPFGILAMLVAPRLRVWSTTLTGLALSLLIEGVQILLPTRYPTLSDLVANTTGALLGALAVAAVHRRGDAGTTMRTAAPPPSDPSG